MTNYHIINDQFLQNNKNIKISINNKKIIEEININEIKIIYSSPIDKYDIMILKLKENNKYNYLELDQDLYKDKSIYILHYPNEDNVSISFGCGIKNAKKSDDEYYIKHLCYIKESSSGSPILNLSTNKVIGIHIESTLNSENSSKFNKGILLKFPLNEMKNEIKLKVKINKEDINKKIYFLDNTKEHKFLKELDNTKIELYINDQIDEYKKYFIPKKEGIYSIKIKFNDSIKDCSNMFANCNNLISIDLSSFNTDKIINMHGMISKCLNLKDIVLSPLYIKKKNLFADKNNEILIKIYKNISSENKEKILSLILNGFNQKIKIQSNGKNKKKR
jgi:surface protein